MTSYSYTLNLNVTTPRLLQVRFLPGVPERLSRHRVTHTLPRDRQRHHVESTDVPETDLWTHTSLLQLGRKSFNLYAKRLILRYSLTLPLKSIENVGN